LTEQGAYIALAILPLTALLSTEPIGASWGYKHARRGIMPVPPLPPELRERSERNLRYIGFLEVGVQCLLVYFLARKYSVPAADIGLQLRRWPILAALGAAVGLMYLVYLKLMRAGGSRLARKEVAYYTPDYLTHGSTLHWVISNIASCFSEEFWRAFCLVSLYQVHHGAMFAVVASSLAFALYHFQMAGHGVLYEFGRLSSYIIFGVLFAALFLVTHSIVPTYSGHLLVNLVALYRARGNRGQTVPGFPTPPMARTANSAT